MSGLSLLLYFPLVGLIVLVWLAGIKLAQKSHTFPRGYVTRQVLAVIGVAFFTIGYVVMVMTHGHDYSLAMLFVMAIALVNAIRMKMQMDARTVQPSLADGENELRHDTGR